MAFQEQTNDEKGFAPLWAAHVEPHLARYRAEFYPRLIIAATGSTALLIGGIWLYNNRLLGIDVPGFAGLAIRLGLMLVWFALVYLACRPLLRLTGDLDQRIRAAVNAHFEWLCLPEDNLDYPYDVARQLRDDGLIGSGSITVKSYYSGAYRHCRVRFFNVDYRTSRSAEHSSNSSVSHFLMVRVSVPTAFSHETRIEYDRGQLLNKLREKTGKMPRIALDHPAFEKVFEVYGEDEAETRQLVSPALCDSLLGIKRYFSRGRWMPSRTVVCQFKDGNFLIAIEGVSDISNWSMLHRLPGQVHKAARQAISQFAYVPVIVDFLHGDAPQDQG